MPKVPNLNKQEKTEPEFGADFKFYKSEIAGLGVRIAEPEDRSEVGIEKVRFVPYEFRDEKKGENYRIGLLATEEPEAIEVLVDDPNVVEIEQAEYEKLVETGKRVPY